LFMQCFQWFQSGWQWLRHSLTRMKCQQSLSWNDGPGAWHCPAG
jgi:hypothetical protein